MDAAVIVGKFPRPVDGECPTIYMDIAVTALAQIKPVCAMETATINLNGSARAV
jgi:hypothetical protein